MIATDAAIIFQIRNMDESPFAFFKDCIKLEGEVIVEAYPEGYDYLEPKQNLLKKHGRKTND